jgi:D-arabinose 5-phosphate isomerase GutQ
MKTIHEMIKSIYPDLFFDQDRQTESNQESNYEPALISGLPQKSRKKTFSEFTDASIEAMLIARVQAIAYAVTHTSIRNPRKLTQAGNLLAKWIKERKIIRIVGAGRALLSGSMPGNRLAHGGAIVSYMGGMVPMPNSIQEGGIIACSASGKTKPVLEAMDIAKKNNPKIKIIGLAKHDAKVFEKLCDVFIGIDTPPTPFQNPLSALADTEEYVIAEILDGLVVWAGKSIGYNDNAWRKGHEDIGPTGPYSPR